MSYFGFHKAHPKFIFLTKPSGHSCIQAVTNLNPYYLDSFTEEFSTDSNFTFNYICI